MPAIRSGQRRRSRRWRRRRARNDRRLAGRRGGRYGRQLVLRKARWWWWWRRRRRAGRWRRRWRRLPRRWWRRRCRWPHLPVGERHCVRRPATGISGVRGGVVLITPVWAKSPTTTTVTVPTGPVYDGNAKTAIGSDRGRRGQPARQSGCHVSPGPGAPVNAGTYTASASYLGDDTYAGSSDSKPFTIFRAASNTEVTVADAVYDGNPHGGTAKVTGAGGLDQALTVSYSGRNGTVYGPSPTAPTNAGDYTASASYQRRCQPQRHQFESRTTRSPRRRRRRRSRSPTRPTTAIRTAAPRRSPAPAASTRR